MGQCGPRISEGQGNICPEWGTFCAEASGKGTSANIGGIKVTGEGVWGQAPELETRNLKKNKKFSFNIYSDFLLTQSYFH